MSLREIPKRLLVIGGGIIGMELGGAYQRLGSELTVVEMLPNVLTGVDADVAAVVERLYVKHGAKILKSAKALGYEPQKDGSLAVRVEVGGQDRDDRDRRGHRRRRHAPQRRRHRPRGARREGREGLRPDRQPRPDERARASTRSATARACRCSPTRPRKEGEVVAEVIAGHKAAKDWVAIPAAIFTDPEIATVGLGEEQAKAKGIEVRVGKFPFAALGRAMAVNETDGFIKVVADKNTHEILGIHIVGPDGDGPHQRGGARRSRCTRSSRTSA